MTDLERVAELLGLNIFQSAENTYITYGQGENTREMLEGISLVLPLLSLILQQYILTVLLRRPQMLI